LFEPTPVEGLGFAGLVDVPLSLWAYPTVYIRIRPKANVLNNIFFIIVYFLLVVHKK
jgi:hypothetical protein